MRDMFKEQWKIVLKNICWKYRSSMNANYLSLVFPWIGTSNWFLQLRRLCWSLLTKREIQSCVACLSLLTLFLSKHSQFITSFSAEIILPTFPNFQTLNFLLIYSEATSWYKTVERNLRQENLATNWMRRRVVRLIDNATKWHATKRTRRIEWRRIDWAPVRWKWETFYVLRHVSS